MPGDEARRDATAARAGDKDMRVILAHPALAGERLDRRGAAIGGVFIERHVLVDLHHQRMQKSEHLGFGFGSQLARKRRHGGVDFGQRRRAQE